MSDSKSTKKILFFVKYTIIFSLCCLGIYYVYYSRGKSLIYDGDGWSQHYKAYIYYSEYLKNIIHNLFVNHKLIIPQWDFSIGEGADIIGTFHYYVIGDPFAFFTILIPKSYIYIYFIFSIVLRMYLSGLFFCILCFYMKKNNYIAIISGALVYVFCFWSIFNSVRHIYFLNRIVYLPLIIIGVEKIINNESSYVFAVSVWISCLSNFYFFYNIVLLTVLYVFIRLLVKFKNNFREIINRLLTIIKYSVFGVLMSAIILLPIIYVFMKDARMGIEFDHHLIYPLLYYYKLPSMFISTSRYYWLCMGFASPVILALTTTIIKFKKNMTLFLLDIIAAVMVLFPIFGQIMNGFSYISNKWSFGLALLVAYNMTEQWDELNNNKKITTIVYCLFSLMCIVFGSGINVNIPLAIGFVFLLITHFNYKESNRNNLKQIVLLILIALNVVFLANWQYSSYGSDYSSYATSIEDNKNITKMSEAYTMSKYNEEKGYDYFYRYSGSDLTQNASILFDVHSTDYYWSLTNPYTAEYRTAMSLDEYKLYNFKEFDKRASLYTLANVKYYVVPNGYNQLLPYNFEYETTIDGYDLYNNKSFLPFGFTYDKAVSLEKWNSLMSSEKEEVLLQAIVINKNINDNVTTNSSIIDFEIIKDNDIEIENKTIKVNRDGASLLLKFDTNETDNVYLNINNVDYDDRLKWIDYKTTQVEIDLLVSDGTEKTMIYGTSDDKYGNGRKDFTTYLGRGVNSVKITFLFAGDYTYDKIYLNTSLTEKYEERISDLKQDVLKNVVFDNNAVFGNISLTKPKYLFLSIPYSKGWSTYIDGKKVETLQANVGYIGLYVSEGSHQIELKYSTPLLKVGAIISAISICLFVVDIAIMNKRKKNGK